MRSRTTTKAVSAPAMAPEDTTRGRIDAEAVTRDRYERAFAAYVECRTDTDDARITAACREVTGLRREACQAWATVGVPELRLPSFRERIQDAARRVVAADRAGTTLEAFERQTTAQLATSRAAAAARARREEEKVLGDAVKQRAEEAKLVRGVRQTATAMIAVQAPLINASMRLAQELLADVEAGKVSITPAKRVELIRNVASIVKQTAETTKLAVHVERVLLGEPTHILGTAPHGPTANMTPDEAAQYVELAQRAMVRAAQRRAVIDADGEDVPDFPNVGKIG